LELRVPRRPLEFSVGEGFVEAAAGNRWRAAEGVVVAVASFERGGVRRVTIVSR